MKNQLSICSFEQAKRLREIEFDWITDKFYHDNGILDSGAGLTPKNYNVSEFAFSAPTVALALKWFRDEKDLVPIIRFRDTKEKYYNTIKFTQANEIDYSWVNLYLDGFFDTYELAESVLLDELLNLIEKEK